MTPSEVALTQENIRLRDLVRYCRHKLHEEGLITDAEYADLLTNTPGSVKRLEAYDRVKLQYEEKLKSAQGILLSVVEVYAGAENWTCHRCHGKEKINWFIGRWVGEGEHGWELARAALESLDLGSKGRPTIIDSTSVPGKPCK